MSGVSWAVWLVVVVAAFALAGYLYRFRELPGRGRGVLIGLRGSTLALLLLLLFDPSLTGPAGGGGERRVLLDGSASMALPSSSGTSTRWAEGVARVRAMGVREVLLFGDAPRSAAVAALDTIPPADPRTRLLPALEAAAQAGARRITLVTDGRLDDAEDVIRWLPRLGITLEVEDVGAETANAAVTRVSAPSWVQTGQPVDIAFEVMTSGPGPDSLAVRVLRDGVEAGRRVIARPGPGRFTSGTLRVTAQAGAESRFVRYEVALEPGDAAASDDVRHAYIEVSAQPAGITIVSFRPDWETRFLYPVLERSLGLPVRAFLRTASAWVEQGTSTRAGRRALDAEVLESLAHAELLVLHGADESAPDAFLTAAASARRLLVFPTGIGRLPGLPLPPTTPVAADWYLSAQIPPSPVASALAGIEVESVPPLTGLRIPEKVPEVWAAGNVNRGRRGAAYPLAIGGSAGGRRWVAALGQGYWRWALRGGAAQATYERLWSALGGWLLEGAGTGGSEAVAPAARVIEAGSPARWISRVAGPDSLGIRILDGGGNAVIDTILSTAGADSATTRPLGSGRYRYAARVFAGDALEEAAGEFTVETASTENIRTSAAERLRTPLSELRAAPRSEAATPLHATAWPYLGLILLLCAEWFLRRRWGLR